MALAVSWLAAGQARADETTAPSAEAVAAFDEGRRLLAEHDYPGAIARFEQSIRSTRTVGALLNLGRAYEESGRAASAWAAYRAGAALARELHDAREADGERFAATVLPHVSHLTIDARAVEGVPGVEITCDGAPAARGEPVPVDSGSHAIAVKAPGKLPWSATTAVGPDGAQVTVLVEPLADAPAPPPDAPLRPGPGPGDASAPPPSSPLRTVGFVVGGVGIVSLGAGAVFGLLASSKHAQAVSDCSSYPAHCPSSGIADGPNHDAQTFATVSTVTFVAGGVALAAGAVLVLTSPSGPQPATAVRLTPLVGSGSVGGSAEVAW